MVTGTGNGTDDGLPTKEASEDGSDLPSLTSAGANSKEKENNGGVKANKGMILRKSVEYIRYLQQLVSAQAARNRSLEAQLVRAGLSASAGDADGGLSSAGMLKFASSFNGSLLEPMAEGDAEMEMDLEMDAEGMDMDAHAQFMNGHGLTKHNDLHDSPGASGSDDHDHDHGIIHPEHEDDVASNSGSASSSEPPRARRAGSGDISAPTSGTAERGRRGRAARAVNGIEGRGAVSGEEGSSGLVAVKEEA